MISLMELLKEAQGAPKAIILSGAPGAGKSSIVGDIISGLKVLNIDDDFITNLKASGVSLDLKKADAPYLDLFGNNFVATTKDKKLVDARDLEDIIDQYIKPYIPTDTKPKTDKEKARSAAQREKLEDEVRDLMSKENVTKAVQQVVSAEEAQQKLKSFLAS
jgi:hypothetical protein